MKKLLCLLALLCFSRSEVYSQACSGIPPSHTLTVSAASVCLGSSVNLSVATSGTVTGLAYQWYTATLSPVGPFVAVTGATVQNLNSFPPTMTTWFMAQVTCTNPGGGTVTATGTVTVPGPVTSTVPYIEDFSAITVNNELPNCSWTATGLGTSALTFTSPGKMAAFSYSPAGTSYFYTNKIWLYAGVTYSTGLWYRNDVSGQTNWSNLSILIGPSQSTTGLIQVAGTNGPFTSTAFTPLSNTFTPSTSGYYHLAVRGTGTTSGSSQYLFWDDLFVNVPCSLNPLVMNVSVSNMTVCLGTPVNVNATGATTYTWNTGGHSMNLSHTPAASTVYIVTGQDTTTGCTATQSINVQVDPTPNLLVYASHAQACAGTSVTLNALGGVQYFWSSGSTSPITVVAPTVSTIYSVMANNQFGCMAGATVQVLVWPLPAITATATSLDICDDGSKTVTLTANGAAFYSWSSNSFYIQANPAVVAPKSSITITVTGTDQNGCSGKTLLALTAHPSPTVTALPFNTLVCLGKQAIFQAFGAATYTWSGGIAGSNMVVVPSVPSVVFYTVTGTNLDGCSSSAIVALVADACVGVTDNAPEFPSPAFPNPSSGNFVVEGLSSARHAEVIDQFGRSVSFTREGNELFISDAAPGVYSLRLYGTGHITVIKLIKQ